MYYCDMVHEGKYYHVTITDNESVSSIIELDSNKKRFSQCVVYLSDGVTQCEDLYMRKRISAIAKKNLVRRTNAINGLTASKHNKKNSR